MPLDFAYLFPMLSRFVLYGSIHSNCGVHHLSGSLGTTDFLERGTDNVVFSTCPQERDKIVFQMGTSDAVRALKAAEIV